MIVKVYKIKSGKLGKWKAWCAEVNGKRRSEAAATLAKEGVSFELFVNVEIDSAWYAVGAAYPVNEKEGVRSSDDSREINARHKEILRECLEPAGLAELGYFLEAW